MSSLAQKISASIDSLRGLFQHEPFEKELKRVMSELRSAPEDARLKLALGEIYFKRREIEKGIQLFREVADQYTEDGFVLKSIAIYKKIIQMSPGSVEFNQRLAELYQQLGMINDAVNQYLIVIQYYQNRQDREKTLEMTAKMVAVNPNDIQNRIRLADVYFNQGLQEQALKEYESIGHQLKSEGGTQLKLLIDILEKVFFRRPKDHNLLKEICTLYLEKKDPQIVLKKIERAKLTEDSEFKPIYLEAKKMAEEIVKNVVAPSTSN